MITAKVIADSTCVNGSRITTFVLTYPRFIHAEFMTHRMISRNAASSRAIPLSKTRRMVRENPAVPTAFSKNQPGMQASDNISPFQQKLATGLWLLAGRVASLFALGLEKLGVHKQHANRILEPWLHITVVATATEWENFFALRYHPAAQPEFQELAEKMWDARVASIPKKLAIGEWHLPFVSDAEKWVGLNENTSFKVSDMSFLVPSVARCARVSFLNHEGKISSSEDDKKLYDRLLGASPIHASPAEHQATPAAQSTDRSGNFRGWTQYRKTLLNENIETFVPLERD